MPVSRDDPARTLDLLALPQVSLMGEVGKEMVTSLLEQLGKVDSGSGPVVFELTTLGGDAEFGRRMALELDLARQRLRPRRLVFLGKTVVYSAGVTFMSAFPCADRYLTRDAMLLIHVRQLEKTVQVQGPMRASLPQLESLCEQIKSGMQLEERDFRRLIEGSRVTMDELTERALYNWYLTAEDALERGLIGGIA
jgi:ATP-dependent protease ClpP protease subunit